MYTSEDWSIVVNITGYFTIQCSTITFINDDTSNEDDNLSSNKNNSNVSKTWKIVTMLKNFQRKSLNLISALNFLKFVLF